MSTFNEVYEELSQLQERIVKKGNKWQVQSEKGRNMGTYDTREEAEKRLKQIEYFKHLNESISDKIIAYHGSNKKFDYFTLDTAGAKSDYGTLGKGIYFTLDKSLAKHYAGNNGYVYTCELDLRNPLIIDTKQKEKELTDATYKNFEEVCKKLNLDIKDDNTYNDARIVKLLQDNMSNYLQNYDGVIAYWSQIPEIILDNDEVCVFNPKAIKIKSIENQQNN